MEIIFSPKGFFERLMNERLNDIDSIELNEIVRELKSIDENSSIKEVNLGPGADWIAILAIINTIVNIFLIGDKIIKGIDGWVELGKKIKNIFSKSETLYFDKDVASLFAVEYISRSTKIASIEKINETVISLKDLSRSFNDRTEKDFISNPYCIYLQAYKINDSEIIILGIRSDGVINKLYYFDEISLIGFPF